MQNQSKINVQNVEDILALSTMQEGMLFHYLTDPESDQYFEQLSLQISGELDAELMREAWEHVVESNEMLRTVFAWGRLEKPVQIVLKEQPVDFRIHDLSSPGEKVSYEKIVRLRTKDRKEKFDLQRGPLIRVHFCKLEEGRYELVISNHHIIYDGWSNGIILREVFQTYQALKAGEKPTPIKKTHFKEYIKWLKQLNRKKQEIFWRDYLKGYRQAVAFPRDSKNEGLARVEHYTQDFSMEMTQQIEALVKSEKATLGAFFYTVWGILLQRYTGNDDAVFGFTVSGRPTSLKGMEEMVGLFINTLPMRVQTKEGERFSSLLQHVHLAAQRCRDYEATPLVDIKSVSELEQGSQLFDTILTIENYPLDQSLSGGEADYRIESYQIFEMSNFDLLVEILTFQTFGLQFSYNAEVFRLETIERIGRHFMKIVSEVVKNPDITVAAIEMLSDEEKSGYVTVQSVTMDDGDFDF